MLELSTVQQVVVWILPVLFAITHHEAAHAYVGYYLGDNTPKLLGRLSFNPIRHIDLVGTIIVPLVVLLLSDFNFIFGWAKPVPMNISQFKHPRRDVALTTAAGPIANLLMALCWAACLKVGILLNPAQSSIALFLVLSGKAGILINLFFAFLNLLPIPPLDGSRILTSFLPIRAAIAYNKLEPYGFLILLILLLLGLLNEIMSPLVSGSLKLIRILFSL